MSLLKFQKMPLKNKLRNNTENLLRSIIPIDLEAMLTKYHLFNSV